VARWLLEKLKCPDEKTNSNGYWIWLHNDKALQGFLLESISSVDLSLVRKLKNSHEIFKPSDNVMRISDRSPRSF
jgi:hypothetical protein